MEFTEREKIILDYIADNPGCTRTEIARGTGLTYWKVRHSVNKYVLYGWIDAVRVGRVYHYSIKRERRTVVTSFQFTPEQARRAGRSEEYVEEVMRRTRHIEVVVTVDKPAVIDIEPEYVLAVFLDYSAWAFSIGTYRGKKAKPMKVVWPARDFWLGEFIRKEQRRIKIKMQETLPSANIHVGSTDVMKSRYRGGEYFVDIVYSDYDYPKNSFSARKLFKKALHEYKEGKFKEKLVGWIMDVDNRNFRWGTVLYFKKKYGGGLKI